MTTAIHESTTLDALKAGYASTETTFDCLFCGHRTRKGHVDRQGDDLVEAELAMREHLTAAHGSVFTALLALTALTVGVTYVDLGDLNVWVALAVATAKASETMMSPR